jgi:exodeoxyribonuclease VII large subunit
MVVSAKSELTDALKSLRLKLEQGMRTKVERCRLSLYQEVMELREKKEIFVSHKMYLDELFNNLVHQFSTYLTAKRTQAESLAQRLSDLNPENILKRGYSITLKKETGEVVISSTQVMRGDELAVRLFRGELGVTVTEEPS